MCSAQWFSAYWSVFDLLAPLISSKAICISFKKPSHIWTHIISYFVFDKDNLSSLAKSNIFHYKCCREGIKYLCRTAKLTPPPPGPPLAAEVVIKVFFSKLWIFTRSKLSRNVQLKFVAQMGAGGGIPGWWSKFYEQHEGLELDEAAQREQWQEFLLASVDKSLAKHCGASGAVHGIRTCPPAICRQLTLWSWQNFKSNDPKRWDSTLNQEASS